MNRKTPRWKKKNNIMKSFQEYLLNEDRAHLGHKVGDVLTAAQDLEEDLENIGARQVMRMSDAIVAQIRRVLHQQWEPIQHDYLTDLQAVAVMIKKAIEEKKNKGTTFDLKETISMAIKQLEAISQKLGQPVNKVQAPPEEGGQELDQDDFEETNPDQEMPQDQIQDRGSDQI
jgi:hypothetical protein